MLFRRPKSAKELEDCVDLYMSQNDYTFLPVDRKRSIDSLSLKVRTGAFIRVMVEDGKVNAWILGTDYSHDHIASRVMIQQYCTSRYTGVKAVRVMREMHKLLVSEAELRNIPLVFSQCSHLDTTFQLCRILSKDGWASRGHTAVFKTKWFTNKEK